MTGVRKLLGAAAAYTLVNALNSAIPFLLLPVLTRVLTAAEYGTVTMFATVMSVLSAFTGLSIHGAVSVRYFDKETDHPCFVGTSLAILGGSTCIVLLAVWLLATPLSQWTSVSEGWLLIAVLASAAQFIIQVRLVIWQVNNEVVRYGVFQIAQTLLNLSLSLGLILMLGMGWEGRASGIVVAVFVFGLLSLVSLHRKRLVSWRWDASYAKASLRFGLPLIPHTMGGMMMAMSDRFIITSILGLGMTGNYAVGAQMGMVIGLIADAFVKAYIPHLFTELRSDKVGLADRVVRQCVFIFICFLLLALIYMSILPVIYELFLGEDFYESVNAARILALGYALQGMYYTFGGFVVFAEKTASLAKVTFIIGVLNIPLTFISVRHGGLQGAAWAFVISQGGLFIGGWLVAQRHYPLPWRKFIFGNRRIS